MKVTVLGCGSSHGTPAAGGYWGICNPDNPKNSRTRASILVQSKTTDILIDATVDLREHLNSIEQKKIDALLLSHAHSDHVNGMDDLRTIKHVMNRTIDTYSNDKTIDDIMRRFPYIFKGDYGDVYKPFLTPHTIPENVDITIGDLDIGVFEQDHGSCTSLGFRFGDFAYSVDMRDLCEASLQKLEGVDTWIVGSAGYHKDTHPTHATLKQIIKWVDRLQPRMTYLSVLSNYMDYDIMCDELPANIRPAYDGMVLEV